MDIELLFLRGKEYGIEDMEVYMVNSASMGFNIYEGKLERYSVSSERNLSIRGYYKGKMGYSYTEKLTDDSINELLINLIQYAQNNESEDVEILSSPSNVYEKIQKRENKLDRYSDEEKIEFLKSLEKVSFEYDSRVKAVRTCGYREKTTTIYIKNTKGLELTGTHSIGVITLSVVARDEKDVQTSYTQMVVDDLLEEYKDKLVREAVSDAVNMLGAASIESKNYEIILRNNVAADLFSNMSPIFFGNIVQKNLSLMKGKIGKRVGVSKLSIIENPLMDNGAVFRTFDDEGTPTYSKYIIENGILKTFLHNKKTAEKEGLKSTGNGFRHSHKSSIGVLATNMYVEKGNTTLEEMISCVDEGIMITEIEGLHAGINSISGEFSLSSNGFLIEKGQITRPICQIVISGNFYGLLNDIVSIGNDIKFSSPEGNYFGSPSLKIKSLTVAGK